MYLAWALVAGVDGIVVLDNGTRQDDSVHSYSIGPPRSTGAFKDRYHLIYFGFQYYPLCIIVTCNIKSK